MLDKRVDFVVGGTQKGGTTALDAYLKQHPEIEMPTNKKELHFFDRPGGFTTRHEIRNQKVLRRYHKQFAWGGGITGEVTPTYMYFPECAPRIRKYNPDMKWIILLRNPIDRAHSAFKMLVHRGTEDQPFSEIIRDEEGFRQKYATGATEYTYLERGRYSQQLRRIYCFFPKANVLVLDSSELLGQPEKALLKITKFLDVQPYESVEPLTRHRSRSEEPMSPEDREFLKSYYRCEVDELSRISGMSFMHWLQ